MDSKLAATTENATIRQRLDPTTHPSPGRCREEQSRAEQIVSNLDAIPADLSPPSSVRDKRGSAVIMGYYSYGVGSVTSFLTLVGACTSPVGYVLVSYY